MSDEMTEAIKERVEFSKWVDTNRLDDHLFIRNFYLTGNELMNWIPHRVQYVVTSDFQAVSHSVWRKAEHESAELLNVDVFECNARADAHEALVSLLGDFQSPDIGRDESVSAGDVSFVFGNSVSLFARANLVVRIRSAGAKVVAVDGLALEIDEMLTFKPKMGCERIGDIELTRIEEPITVPLSLKYSAPEDRTRWYKFFTHPRELRHEDDSLIYPAGDQPEVIEAFEVNPKPLDQDVRPGLSEL